MKKIMESLKFASEAHKDQRRKGSGNSPYVNHLIEVAHLLTNIAQIDDEDIILAGVLHDILEDTDVPPEIIEEKFGAVVLRYIRSLSDDKSKTLEERRQIQLKKVESAEVAIKLIKLADHSSNVSFIPPNWSEERVSEYLAWSEKVASKCFSVSEALASEYSARLARSKELAGSA